MWNCEWPWDGIRVNKGEIVVIIYVCGRDKVE